MSPESEHQGSAGSPDVNGFLIQAHMAEYQALTTRATYMITLMAGIWPLVLVAIALAAQLWRSFPRPFLLWGSGVVLQTMLIFWTQLLIEQYQIVRYVEAELRPLIQPLVGEAPFWQYEPWLAKGRTKAPIFWEYSVVIGVAVAVIIAAIVSFPFSTWDYMGLAANLCFLTAVAIKTAAAIKTRHRFFVH